MKCPYCGNESGTKDVCAVCGKKMEPPGQEIEIEYKEFKVSEFMEIRKKKQKIAARGTVEDAGGREEDGGNREGGVSPAGVPSRREGRKRRFFTILALLILAAVAGAYLILRLLHR